VRGRRTARRRRAKRVGSLLGEDLELVPPGRVVAAVGSRRRKGGGESSDQGAHMHGCLLELGHTPFFLRLLLGSPSGAQGAERIERRVIGIVRVESSFPSSGFRAGPTIGLITPQPARLARPGAPPCSNQTWFAATLLRSFIQ